MILPTWVQVCLLGFRVLVSKAWSFVGGLGSRVQGAGDADGCQSYGLCLFPSVLLSPMIDTRTP